MSNWVTIQTPIGKCESSAQMEPLPAGPYIILNQFMYTACEGLDWSVAVERYVERIKVEIPTYMWGNVALANVDGKAQKVFYHYDTSG